MLVTTKIQLRDIPFHEYKLARKEYNSYKHIPFHYFVWTETADRSGSGQDNETAKFWSSDSVFVIMSSPLIGQISPLHSLLLADKAAIWEPSEHLIL